MKNEKSTSSKPTVAKVDSETTAGARASVKNPDYRVHTEPNYGIKYRAPRWNNGDKWVTQLLEWGTGPRPDVSQVSAGSYFEVRFNQNFMGKPDANVNGSSIKDADPLGLTKTCTGEAAFTAVGPNQATGVGAFGFSPPNDSVAISPASFGLPYETMAERVATQALIKSNIGNIRISAPGLGDHLSGGTTFSIGDVGDRNIRNSSTTRFDIYRFESQKGALSFGRQTAAFTITGVPDRWKCP